jgi:hypothetical protein
MVVNFRLAALMRVKRRVLVGLSDDLVEAVCGQASSKFAGDSRASESAGEPANQY